MNSNAGLMLNSVFKDQPTSEGFVTATTDLVSPVSLSNPLPSPSANASLNAFPGVSIKPTNANNPYQDRKEGFIDSISLGNRFNVGAQAGLADNASMGVVTQSNTNLAVADSKGDVQSGVIQETIHASEQAAVNHQQMSNLATTKSDGTRSEKSESEETRTGKNYSASHGASTRTGIDMSVLTRDESLRVFGSPVAALEALSTSVEQRVSFGRHVRTLADQENLTAEVKSAVSSEGVTSPLPTRNLDTEHGADGSGIKAAGDYSFRQITDNSDVKLGEERIFRSPVSDNEMDNFYWNRGLIIASSANYQDEETGLSSVTSRSFLFGLTYDSPQQFYADLRARSETEPEFKQALIDLGRESNSRGNRTTIETDEILERLSRKD